MSEFGNLLQNEAARQKRTAKDLAAAMGVDASLMSQFGNDTRRSCRPDTLMKMVAGISDDPHVQARLLEAYFRDQCTPRYKEWIEVRAGEEENALSTAEDPGEYGDPVADHAQLLRSLLLSNDAIRALSDIARAIPGRPKFRLVVEDLGQFAREDLLDRSED